jgi:hypothetical protein
VDVCCEAHVYIQSLRSRSKIDLICQNNLKDAVLNTCRFRVINRLCIKAYVNGVNLCLFYPELNLVTHEMLINNTHMINGVESFLNLCRVKISCTLKNSVSNFCREIPILLGCGARSVFIWCQYFQVFYVGTGHPGTLRATSL